MFIIKKMPAMHVVQDQEEKGFYAMITMNSRDSMVFVEIQSVPTKKEETEKLLIEFQKLLSQNYGGKIAWSLSPKLHVVSKAESVSSQVYFIAQHCLQQAMEKIQKKETYVWVLKQDLAFVDKDSLIHKAKDLSEFKIEHASFVTEQKIQQGLYSEEAEKAKLLNPNVLHFALEKEGKIIACVMGYKHANKIYISDFIIHTNYRNKGIAQFLLERVSKHLSDSEIDGAWFIAGGDGQSEAGKHLIALFNAQPINTEHAQKALGLFIRFLPPQKELLLAANRHERTGESLDKSPSACDALSCFKFRQRSTITFFPPTPDDVVPSKHTVSTRGTALHPAAQINS